MFFLEDSATVQGFSDAQYQSFIEISMKVRTGPFVSVDTMGGKPTFAATWQMAKRYDFSDEGDDPSN